MSTQIRCDGCGATPVRAAMEGRRRRDMDGDDAPPPEWDWCRSCTWIAFQAVAAAERQRAARRAAEQQRPSPARPRRVDAGADDRTAVMERPERPVLPVLPAGNGVGALLGWMPRGGGDRDVTAILPVRGRQD